MYKKLYALILVPYLLFGWGGDFMVAQSDTSSGVFYLYNAVMGRDQRQAIFAVKDKSPYYMYVYLEDSAQAGTFSEVSTPMNFNSRPARLLTYYNWTDSMTYMVAYLPDYGYSNLLFLPYHQDYSWDYTEFRNIDGTPDDTLIYPDFKGVYVQYYERPYFFVSCVKRTASYDSVFIYTSRDTGNTWQRHYISTLTSGRYKDLDIEVNYLHDTIFLWRVFSATSNDTTYWSAIRKYMYDPSTDSFFLLNTFPLIQDSFIYSMDIAVLDTIGILAYQANGGVKIRAFSPDSMIGSPTDITPQEEYDYLIGVVKGLTFQLPNPIIYFGIAYTSGISVIPNTQPIYYVETSDGTSFYSMDTLNNNPSTQPLLISYDEVVNFEPAVLYLDVDYHGSSPFYWWDNTTLYADRRSNITEIRENKGKNIFTRSILTGGYVQLTLSSESVEPVEINLYSPTGRLVRNIYKGNVTNNLTLNFDISELHPGVYFIKDTKGTIYPIKILKK